MAVVRALITFNTPYAAVQHERTDFEHPRGGKAKYLEDPLKQMAPGFPAFLAARVRSAVSAEEASSAADAADLIIDALEAGVGAYAEIVLGMAQQEAPILEGILRGSGEVETTRLRSPG